MMSDVRKVLSDKEAISNWEDEGGVLKPVIVSNKPGNKTRLVWLASLITLPFLFWLAKRQFQK